MTASDRYLATISIKYAAETYALEGRHDLGVLASSLLANTSVEKDGADVFDDLKNMCEQALLLIRGSAPIGSEERMSDEVVRLCERLLMTMK